MSVVKLNTVKDYLDLQTTNDTRDARLQKIIDIAEAKIGTRIALGPREVEVTVTPNGGYLVLPVVPVLELTSITPNVGDALDVSLLTADAAGVVSYIVGGGTFPGRSYAVVYQAGYAEDALPATLEGAVLELVRHLWTPQRGEARRPGSTPEESQQLGFLLPHRVQELLADYELPGIA